MSSAPPREALLSPALSERPARKAPYAPAGTPAPLLLPAIAFMAGITSSHLVARDGSMLSYAGPMTLAVPLTTAIAAPILWRLAESRPVASAAMLRIALLIVAFAAGAQRYMLATSLPPDHIVHAIPQEPVLARLAGEIVTPPVVQPAEKRNLFLPVNPQPRTTFLLAARELRSADRPVRVQGYVQVAVEGTGPVGAPGDELVITGRLYRPQPPRNPGEVDWANLLRLQGIHAGLSVAGPEYVERAEGGHQTRITNLLRSSARRLLFDSQAGSMSPEVQGVLDAMVLGQRSAVSREINEAFVRTGAIHILSVSGTHVGLLAAFAWIATRGVLRRGTRAAAWTTIAALVLYVLIAEQNAPILRAVVIGVLVCTAVLRDRPVSFMNWLALAAVVILVVNPLELFRAGFQLSFVQVIALITIAPPVAARLGVLFGFNYPTGMGSPDALVAEPLTLPGVLWRHVRRGFGGLVIASIVAWIAAAPLTVYHFERVAPLGAFQSMAVLPLAMVTIVLGFATLLLGFAPVLASWMAIVLNGLTAALLWLTQALGNLPGTLLEARSPPAWLMFLTYAAGLPSLAFVVRRVCRVRAEYDIDPVPERPSGSLQRVVAAAGLLSSLAAWFIYLSIPSWRLQPSEHEFWLLSVGDGQAAAWVTPDRTAVCIDAGTSTNSDAGLTVRRVLRERGVARLDALVVSHADIDHYSGVPSLLSAIGTDSVRVNPRFAASRSREPAVSRLVGSLHSRAPLLPASAGDRLSIRGSFARAGGSIEVLWPPAEPAGALSDNDGSLVIRIQLGGHTILVPGDIERAGMRGLLDRSRAGEIDLRSTIIVAPHHGSIAGPETAEFYRTVNPRLVLVSSGKPRDALLRLIQESVGPDCRMLNTDETGAICVRLPLGGRMVVQTARAD